MISDNELNKGLLTLRIIWLAMLFTLAVYVVAGHIMARNALISETGDDFIKHLRPVLYLVALVELIVMRFVRRYLLSKTTPSVPDVRSYQHPILQKYTTATIVTLAMSESIGIYGLMLYIIGRNDVDLYGLIFVSAAAMIFYRPKRDELIALAQERRI